jgi:hypothetical protein
MKEKDENEEDVLLIHNIDEFVEETYLFSLINLDSALLPEIRDEKDPIKREELKEGYLLNHSKEDLDPDDLLAMREMYPVNYAKEIIIKYLLKNDENELFINVIDMMKAVEDISRGMLYALFDKMHKDGLVDLVWDSNKGDFAYTIKRDGSISSKDERDTLQKDKDRKTKKPRKKK